MTQLIRIAPGVWFSSDVLSPAWGRQRQNNARVAPAFTSTPVATPPLAVAPDRDGPALNDRDAQLSLLLDV